MASVSFGVFSKRRNSTKQPTNELSDARTVTLKEDCSQDRPIFKVTGNNFNYNYCSWDGKYYFIDEIISLRNNEIEVHCVMDPLATYKAEILASTQYVSYSSQLGDTWLPDTRIPCKTNTLLSVSTSLTGILSTIGCYILTVVGKDSCTTFMIQSESTLHAILTNIQSWENQGILDAINHIVVPSPTASHVSTSYPSTDDRDVCFSALIDTIKSFGDAVNDTAKSVQDAASTVMNTVQQAACVTGFTGNAYLNAPSCIRSCIWVPFDYALAPASGGSGQIMLGTYDTGQSGVAISGKPVTRSNTISIPWHYSDWRRAICEDVYLYLPLVGMVQLSGDSLTNVSSLTIETSVTYTDGAVTYKVLAGSSVIGSYGAQCASNYPMGIAQQASAGEIMNALMGGAEKMLSGVVQSSISPVSIVGAVLNVGLTAFNTGYQVDDIKHSTHISCVGGVGGGAGIGLGRDCVCYTVAHPTIIDPADMKDTMGLPTMKPLALSTLTGFCQCANAHIDAPATAGELDAIDSMLNAGFFIE